MIDDYDAAPAIVKATGVLTEGEEPPLLLSQEEEDDIVAIEVGTLDWGRGVDSIHSPMVEADLRKKHIC